MVVQSDMPTFKKGDLVRNFIALPVARTERTISVPAVQDPDAPQQVYFQTIPSDSSPVQGLLINTGVVFVVDAVLPWDDPEETTSKRYRIVLNAYYFPGLDEPERQFNEAEFASLNTILAEEGRMRPFYAFADDEDLVLWSARDGRTPGKAVVKVWPADDNFPWTVRLHFPRADEVLRYDIQAWFYEEDEDSKDELGWFLLWLQPLYANEAESTTLLSLQAKPGKWNDLEQPIIEFQSVRKAQCRFDLEEHTIDIVIQFSILVDLERNCWQFVDDNRSCASLR